MLPFALAAAMSAQASEAPGTGAGAASVQLSGPGINFTSPVGETSLRLLGLFQYDNNFYDGAYNDLGTGTASDGEFRRVRLGVEGHVRQRWRYWFEINIDEKDQKTTVDTALIAYDHPQWGSLTMGRFKRPVGLEVLTDSTWITTMERAAIWDAVPNNEIADFGVMYDRAQGKAHVWLGGFDNGSKALDTGLKTYGGYGRATWAPWNETGRVLHFGISAADQIEGGRTFTTATSRFGVHTLPYDFFQFVNEVNLPARTRSALFEARHERQAGAELAGAWGAFSAQSEYVLRQVDRINAGKLEVRGGYLQLAYTLTGEPRRYDAADGVFDLIEPRGDWGAWEVALKAERDSVNAGHAGVDIYTAALNWQPNLYFRFSVDYIKFLSQNLAFGNAFNNDGSAITTRIQFQF